MIINYTVTFLFNINSNFVSGIELIPQVDEDLKQMKVKLLGHVASTLLFCW